MMRFILKSIFNSSSLLAATMLSLSTGCASGGFKLTREYARFVNSKQIILRIVLYILTFIVFAATMLIDMVVFNTMDFWEGRVSQGDYEFKQGERTYQAHHEISTETQLKSSKIKVFGKNKELIQEVYLAETLGGEIEVFIDGKLNTRVRNISEVPIAATYDAQGSLVEEKALWFSLPTKENQFAGR